MNKALGEGDFDNMLKEEDGELLDNPGGRKQQIEISCPIFLRPIMKSILAVGKSIKIVRYLESGQLKQTSRSTLD